MKQITFQILFIFTCLILSVLNIIYHHWSDWEIGLLTQEHVGFKDSYSFIQSSRTTVFSSLYSPFISTRVSIIQTVFISLIAGTALAFLFKAIIQKIKISYWLIFLIVILWVIKVPVAVTSSTLPGIERFLFVW